MAGDVARRTGAVVQTLAPAIPLQIQGAAVLWFFNGAAPANYAISAQYSCNKVGGQYQWVASPELHLAGPQTATPTATAVAPSAALNGASIQLAYTPPNGPVEHAALALTVKAPTTVNFLNAQSAADVNWGYLSQIHYDICDQFGALLPANVPINEQFTGAIVYDYNGSNWVRGPAGGALVAPANWDDNLQGQWVGPPAPIPPPLAPNAPTAAVRIHHFPGEWRVGSLVPGQGQRVTSPAWAGAPTCVWLRRQGFAQHE